MWLVFLTLILLTRLSQRVSLVSGGGQQADYVPPGCRRLISISRKWGWARHLPGGWRDGGPWSPGKRVWNNRHLRKGTKISMYSAAVLTTLLYGAESWVTYRRHLRLLERFHQCCLRSILNIHWSDFITNIEVLERAEVNSIEAMLLKTQLRWGQGTFPEWRITACPRSCCMESCPLAIVTEGLQRLPEEVPQRLPN